MDFQEMKSPMAGMRVWGANCGEYHFVISHEDGTRLRAEDRKDWVGYTASYKTYAGRNEPAIRIEGRWPLFTLAVEACDHQWRTLRACR